MKITTGAREIEIAAKADVVVAGGGPAGSMAAIRAARSGAETILIERSGCAGGIWTSGLLSWMLDVSDKKGLLRELMDRLQASNEGSFARGGNFIAFPEAVKRALDDMLLKAGVRVFYYTSVADALVAGRRITHAVVESKAGRQAISGKVFVDATGDGDLSKLAGCRYEIGKPGTGETQPVSLIGMMTGVKAEEVRVFNNTLPYEQAENAKRLLFREMQRAGVTPSYDNPSFFHVAEDVWLVMTTHGYGVDALNPESLTEATIRLREEMYLQEKALRALGGAWKNMRIVATAPMIGVRESRRILGRYTVSLQDAVNGVRHEDAVCRVNFPLDVHPLKNGNSWIADRGGYTAKPYDIPLRALEAMDIDNLLLAGRLISGDFYAHSSYRVTGDAAQLGEAAGREAAFRALKA